MPFIDISGWIDNGMWSYSTVYPGATITECPHPPELPEDYAVYCQRFVMGGQTGTYIETKAHVDPAGPAVSACPVEDFVMEAAVLRVNGKGENAAIRREDLEKLDVEIPRDGAVILATGWDAYWEEAEQFVEGSPYIERDAALWLFDHGIRCLAGDFPRFDYVPRPCFPWAEFWARVPYLLAPVCNVYRGEFTRGRLYAFPLKIRGAMGTPVRAVLDVA
ncbi:MAG TPA: cyclase family protein [Candidatus Hydrogenedentes bacterium]|nr:cyclase family protein [Candidatus Hydrogenedentota bacterium]